MRGVDFLRDAPRHIDGDDLALSILDAAAMECPEFAVLQPHEGGDQKDGAVDN